MSIPRIFHHVWPGTDEMPEGVLAARRTWIERHPGWEFRIWRPEDLSWLRNKTLFDQAPSYAQKADIARYEVVHRYGGVYLDTDMECLRPLDPLLDGWEFFAARELGGEVCVSIFGAAASHPILGEAIMRLPASCLFRRGWSINVQTGPGLLDRTIRGGGWELREGVRIFPPAYFYPYDYTEPWRRDESFPRAYAVHRWNHSWKDQKGLDVHVKDLAAQSRSAAAPSVDALWREGRDWVREGRDRVVGIAKQRIVHRAKRFVVRARRSLDLQPQAVRAVLWRTNEVLVAAPFNTRLLCPTDDLSISPELATTGTYDQAFVDFLRQRLARGMTFVDVGANIGLFTVLAGARVGPGGRVFAYECNPELVPFLQRNVRMNWFDDRVRLIAKAAHRDDDERSILVPRDLWGNGSLTRFDAEKDGELNEYTVECERLDQGLRDVRYVDLLKIDVEGGEGAVLDGASGLLDEGRVGIISMELRADVMIEALRESMGEQLTSLVRDRGATLHILGDSRSIRLDDVLTVFHYAQLIICFPGASIQLR